jgi:undecaprenyl diphosphate synthase
MEDLKIPNHVGIIMDGNGRWATKRGLSRSLGHKAGADTLEELVEYVFEKGVKVLSVFAFSTENFKRDEKEVNYLMDLFVKRLDKIKDNCEKNNIKMVFSGRRKPLSDKVLDAIDNITEFTKNNDAAIFNVCLNYGGQAEIVDVVKSISEKVLNGDISIDDIDETVINENLYQDLPPIDLLIRTSGEERISNFMLYQLAYAEMYFPKVLFPDFKASQFDEAIDAFNHRDRRFGGIKK